MIKQYSGLTEALQITLDASEGFVDPTLMLRKELAQCKPVSMVYHDRFEMGETQNLESFFGRMNGSTA